MLVPRKEDITPGVVDEEDLTLGVVFAGSIITLLLGFFGFGVHTALIYGIHRALNHTLPTGFATHIEQRVYVTQEKCRFQPDISLVRRLGRNQRRFRLWPVGLRSPLPTIRIPLTSEAEAVEVNVQEVVKQVYEEAGYDRSIDYTLPPDPPLPPDDTAWAALLLTAQ